MPSVVCRSIDKFAMVTLVSGGGVREVVVVGTFDNCAFEGAALDPDAVADTCVLSRRSHPLRLG